LADQVKGPDWAARKAQYKGLVSTADRNDVRAKIDALIEP